MHRENKEKILRRNIEVSTERWKRAEEKRLKRDLSPKEKQNMRKEFEDSARRIDRTKLHELWNN